MKRRWYDKITNIDSILKYIQEMDQESKEALITNLIESTSLIKNSNKEGSKSSVSLGADKILNLYKAQNKRRWYDIKPELATIMNTIYTLPEGDFVVVIESLQKSINNP